MNRTRTVLLAATLTVGLFAWSGCGRAYAKQRDAVDAEWAITNARADEINAEYMRLAREAKTPDEKNAAIQWRSDELEKNFTDHRARMNAKKAE